MGKEVCHGEHISGRTRMRFPWHIPSDLSFRQMDEDAWLVTLRSRSPWGNPRIPQSGIEPGLLQFVKDELGCLLQFPFVDSRK